MVARPPILAFDNNSWFSERRNRQQLLSRLAGLGWRVVYSNGPADWWERGSDRWRQSPRLGSFVKSEGVLIDLPSRLLPRWRRLPLWDKFAVDAHARHLRRLAGHPAAGQFILFFFNPMFFEYVRILDPRWVAFHVRDVFPEIPGWDIAHQADYEKLIHQADLLTVPAPSVTTTLPESERSKARLLLNGADVQLFKTGSSLPCPSDLAAIATPRIGYVGVVSLKIDFELLAELAKRRPVWQWVFIGPIPRDHKGLLGGDPTATQLWEECLALPNVHYLGPRPYEELPAYMAHMDVNTQIYRIDGKRGSWARYAFPLKLNEYLATGRPVVSCDLKDVRRLRSVVALVDGADAWERALAEAIENDGVGTPALRLNVAHQHSWDSRAAELDEWLRDLVRQER